LSPLWSPSAACQRRLIRPVPLPRSIDRCMDGARAPRKPERLRS
jgi:hypothetical protein